MKVDVVLLTLNSNSPIFHLCLERLEKVVPVNRLIVVDGGSSDRTLTVVKNYGFPVEIIDDSEGNRATARQKGLEEVETEFFLFLDDDVLLSEGWWDSVKKYFNNEKVGAVWGVSVPIEPSLKQYFRAMSVIHGETPTILELKNGIERGMTHDTVVRTEAVEGIRIPENLIVLEDEFIKRYVEGNGYIWVATEEVRGYHYKTKYSTKDIFAEGKIGRVMGLYGKKWFRTRLVKGLFKLSYLLLVTGNKEIMEREMKKQVNYLRGWLYGATES